METLNDTTMQRSAERLADLATAALAEAETIRDAVGGARDAEAELLEAVGYIAARLGAVAELWTPVRVRHYTTAGRDGSRPVEDNEYAPLRGIVVRDERSSGHDGTGDRGWYGGRRWVLWSDGTLARLEREGSWSRWQGEGSEWTDTIVPLTARQAVEAIDADKVIARLTERLERYLAHPTEPIVTDAERARDRFRAALAVLKEAAR